MAINLDEQGRPWTITGGGPVIVVPAETAAAWRGTLPPVGADVPPGWTWGSPGGVPCDYDRACDPVDRQPTPFGGFGWVLVADRPALILDGEIPTTWRAEPGGGTLSRLSYDGANEDADALAPAAWRPYPVATIELVDGRLFMFDSAFAGHADPAAILAHDGVGVIDLGPGRWALTCATSGEEVDFVRFRRAP